MQGHAGCRFVRMHMTGLRNAVLSIIVFRFFVSSKHRSVLCWCCRREVIYVAVNDVEVGCQQGSSSKSDAPGRLHKTNFLCQKRRHYDDGDIAKSSHRKSAPNKIQLQLEVMVHRQTDRAGSRVSRGKDWISLDTKKELRWMRRTVALSS